MEQDYDSHAHHARAHVRSHYRRAFAIGIAVNLAYLGGEAVAGIFSGSLALLADAAGTISATCSGCRCPGAPRY